MIPILKIAQACHVKNRCWKTDVGSFVVYEMQVYIDYLK